MRNEPSVSTSDLLTPDLFTAAEAAAEESPSQAIARDFVRWCWSFGGDFRNSPDINNLRFWLKKSSMSPSPNEEGEILVGAREMFMNKVRLSVRKAEAARA